MRPLKVISILLCLFMTTGCWNMREIEDRNQVLAMAIDRVGDNHQITVEVPMPSNKSGGGQQGEGGGGEQVAHYTAQGRSLYQILSHLQTQMHRTLFLGHMDTVIFGKEETEKDIRESLDLLFRSFDVSRRINLLCTDGKAKDLLMRESSKEWVNATYLSDLIRNNLNEEALMNTDLITMFSDLSTPTRQAPVINQINVTENGFSWEGMVVFHQHRKVGSLSPKETLPLLHIRAQQVGAPLTIPCQAKGSGIIEFRPYDVKRTIAVRKKRKVLVSVELEGEVVEKTCQVDLANERVAREINHRVKQKYESIADQVIKHAQQDWNTDIFELGHYIHAFYPGYYRRFDWQNDFASVPVEIQYHIQLRRIGMET